MSFAVLCAASLLAALLTFVSGFGLGTLLLPAFALFVPPDVAVAATAAVHLANNLFKFALTARDIHAGVLARFAIPAVPAALAGALVLDRLALSDHVLARAGPVRLTPLALGVGLAMILFALLELLPATRRVAVPPRWTSLGGLLSGFFGGLSGHQGALRAVFLARTPLTKEQLIATSAAAAILVDLARLGVYGVSFFHRRLGPLDDPALWRLVGAASLAAFVGSIAGQRLLRSMTHGRVRSTIGVLLLVLGALITLGMV